jgi:hypothetical protein
MRGLIKCALLNPAQNVDPPKPTNPPKAEASSTSKERKDLIKDIGKNTRKGETKPNVIEQGEYGP